VKECTPASAGFASASAGVKLGCASCETAADGRELWRLPEVEQSLSERLTRLGRRGVFGFVDCGRDGTGIWLLRAARVPTLRDAIQKRRGAWPFREVLELAADIARAMSACEKVELLPGAVTPDSIALGSDSRFGFLYAERLLAELVGAPAASPEAVAGHVPARWLPPEQAGAEPWDARANRYVLGLIVYRLLAGEHAFKTHGLRLGFEEQRSAGAPPFVDEVARALPPGLQSLCLQMLHPDLAQRPPSAANIERRLRAFLDDTQRVSAEPRRSLPVGLTEPATPLRDADESTAQAGAALPRASSSWRRAAALLPLCAALIFAGWLSCEARENEARRPALEQRALGAYQTQSQDCAQCHTRQVAEWRRSVMAHSAKSPLFLALEMLIQEQVGRSRDCPDGAGVLRAADPNSACRDPLSGLPITGSGGELWCVNCHAPAENANPSMPAWQATERSSSSRRPLRDLLSDAALEGISCGFCHQTVGPAHPQRGAYQGNPSWRSSSSGVTFVSRPEDALGRFGIANSGYFLDKNAFLLSPAEPSSLRGSLHRATPPEVANYRASSEFCGTCHDVRLFGTDVLGAKAGEHFKRLRNAYSEWRDWAALETSEGRQAASCQGCHMSTFPGVCVAEGNSQRGAASPEIASVLARVCPPGTRFEARPPFAFASGHAASNSSAPRALHAHYFSGVDVPLSEEFAEELLDDSTLDSAGIPLGARQRRDLLLASSVRFALGDVRLRGSRLDVPVVVENVGAGHRVPAGFSQERELWVHLRVTDRLGRLVYEVGRVEDGAADLADKRFLRVNVDDAQFDANGRPLGMFGADVADGPDAPRWLEDFAAPSRGARSEHFRGRGIVNFQNGFLRCVTCIGEIDTRGRCQPLPGQDRARGDRFADGDYDPDTGVCQSNLSGMNALFETYFPVGGLDASRGVLKAPRAPRTYTYELDVRAGEAPFKVEARLLFRAFPPFLLRAFIDYERLQVLRGRRPSGPLIGPSALERLDVAEVARQTRVLP